MLTFHGHWIVCSFVYTSLAWEFHQGSQSESNGWPLPLKVSIRFGGNKDVVVGFAADVGCWDFIGALGSLTA
ncbi:hypothetical protein I7I50_07360 [Histoplasma capsulatum G186AR]|uniref:Uncharacterized protein n=1 Tax=Ajellomyces capsulatus TaxID=5037 RepID=A0A8H7YVH2_AJECA|nr:hypothetical protein I7I52_09568 [Histoplasma capsulatum]QSS68075.1 hypothetical protein I7I50_07360 [Histoplasma capsulatum G186AR]